MLTKMKFASGRKNLRFDGFSGRKPPSSRQQGPDRRLCFFAAFTSYYEESDRDQTLTAKNPTKSMNSHQKIQEYSKGKSPFFFFFID